MKKKIILLVTIFLLAILFTPFAHAQVASYFDDFNDLTTYDWTPVAPRTGAGTGNWWIDEGKLHQYLHGDHYKIVIDNLSLSDQTVETQLFF